MSVSAISSGANPKLYVAAFQAAVKQSRTDFLALANALQSADVAGARTAFAALQQDIQNAQNARPAPTSGGQSSDQQSGQSTQWGNDFQALGSALQSGDIGSAKTAFAALQQDLRAVRHRMHHHHFVGAIVLAAAARAGTSAVSTSEGDAGSQSVGSTIDVKS
jgi:hypothetical protein